jgi:MFS family permease
MKYDSSAFRYTVLVLNCLFVFGPYFGFDLPSTIKSTLTDETGIDEIQYGSLYSSYSIANFATVLFGGAFIDRFGIHLCSLAFIAEVFVGSICFTAGAMSSSFPLMLVGRALYGSGNGCLCVAQNVISAKYFSGRELGLAFGCTLTVSRLGSVLNFWFSAGLCDKFGLHFILLLSSALIGVSLLAVIAFIFADKAYDANATHSVSLLTRDGEPALGSPSEDPAIPACSVDAVDAARKPSDAAERRPWCAIEPSVLRKLPLSFYIVTAVCALYYDAVFPAMAVWPDLFNVDFGYDKVKASRVSGIVYDVALLTSIPLGKMVDRIGHRVDVALAAVFFQAPAHIILASGRWPAFACALTGVGYTLAAASIWSCTAIVVAPKYQGSANALMTAIQMGSVSLMNLAVGAIKQAVSYHAVELFFVLISALAACCILLLKAVDQRAGAPINSACAGKPKASAERDVELSSSPLDSA